MTILLLLSSQDNLTRACMTRMDVLAAAAMPDDLRFTPEPISEADLLHQP